MAGGLLAIVGTALTLISPALPVLFATRFMAGVGAGVIGAEATSVLSRGVDRERLIAAFAGAPEKPLTRLEVAGMFGVTPCAVDAWRRDGKLPAVYAPGGDRVLGFDRADVLKLRRAAR